MRLPVKSLSWIVFVGVLTSLVLVGAVACQLVPMENRSTGITSAQDRVISPNRPAPTDRSSPSNVSAETDIVWGEVPKQCA
jgi:hypothetical protein